MSDRKAWAIFAGLMVIGLLASYGLARAGEPQSVWLWSLIL